MRIHRLEMQAFGPFADRQAIDFDELGAHGLFLLNGPTGAGKTSVLDAICFGLYGTVPGARQQGRRLRSDHAAQDTPPEVVCEFSSGVRRFEVVRSPQWERPAKRAGGKGTVTEQAKTLLREFVDGAWVQKSSRNDEASAEITELLGMNRDQFTRVVMLPQGDFAAFLRADAASREQLLQQLFGTSRFEDIERRLKAELVEATDRFETAQEQSEHVLRRARDEIRRYRGETADGSGPDDGGEAEGGETELEQFQAELDSRTAAARKELAELMTARESAEKHLQEFEHRRARGVALQQLIRDEAEHAASEAEIEPQRAALATHAAASLLAGSVRAQEAAAGRAENRRTEAAVTLQALADHVLAPAYAVASYTVSSAAETPLPDGLEARVSADLAAARAAREDEERTEALLARAGAETDAAEAFRVQAVDADASLDSLRAEEAELAGEAAALGRLAEGEARAEAALAAAEELVATISSYAAANERAAVTEKAAADARQEYQDLRQRWQDLLQSRLDQAAAELAQELADGTPCPVCGGLEHPRPAELPDGEAPVTREAEQAAKARAGKAEAAYEEARRLAGTAAEEAAALRARGGAGDAASAQDQLDAARAELEDARGAVRALAEADRRLTAIAVELAAAEAARSEALISAAQADSRAAAAREQAAELSERLREALQGFPSISERVQSLALFAKLAAAAREAAGALAAAEEELDRVSAELDAALAGTTFASAAEVTAALLDAATADAYASAVSDWEEQGRRLLLRRESQAAAGPDDAAGEPLAVPDEEDVAEAADAAAAARKEQEEAALLVRLLEGSAVRLAEYSAELEAALKRTAPLRARRDLLQSVADTARGGGENQYKMTLSTYVLAARLEQVAAAATERLAAMTGGRYALVHNDSKSGNRKAGLGLHVTDEWTGQHRDTSTLSGGESFMASLALALGLADVVQQEAGGVNIETLFVDEGFGSLDEQSLEQVMDALEGLRDGGRVVGLVSHVAEMKQRIPAQLQILKGRNGSSVRYSAGVPG
ncbi:SMC family ATPase [Arthrobacter sp. zg-Y859]|uniref:Nuclease SbcCD subunit C n=1 Tax=Arthrobacter jinronghuae TaxID=2964609 RepID=A0ABT1NPG3_9MICC|nr:SMC family ATPase [Arthrobacter jinronghuae]MCQ1949625.1 SMC family ATPase [Arthrobacter jinronghuae]UWX77609.1 SMC family ATPase [Arthrobacter jinronghuae]